MGGSSSGAVEGLGNLHAKKSLYVGSTAGSAGNSIQISQYNYKLIFGGLTAGSASLEAGFYGFPSTIAASAFTGKTMTIKDGLITSFA